MNVMPIFELIHWIARNKATVQTKIAPMNMGVKYYITLQYHDQHVDGQFNLPWEQNYDPITVSAMFEHVMRECNNRMMELDNVAWDDEIQYREWCEKRYKIPESQTL